MGDPADDLTRDAVLYSWKMCALFNDLCNARRLGMSLDHFLLEL